MADPVRLRVEGGIGGITARLADLAQAGALLRLVAAELGDRGRVVLAVAADPGVQVTAPLSPLTFAAAEVALGAASGGVGGLLPLAARVEALGVVVGVAVAGYRAADAEAAAGIRACDLLAGRAAGWTLGKVLPELLAGAAVGVLVIRLETSGKGSSRSSSASVLSEPLRRAGDLTLRLLADHAELTGLIVPAVPGVVGGITDALPGGSVIAPAVFRRPGGPATIADLAAGIGAVAGLAGGLRRGQPQFRDPGPVIAHAARVPFQGTAADLGELVNRIPSSESGAATIHVERVAGSDGVRRWVVSIPGTATWSPIPGPTPFDATGDVRLMAGERSSGTAGVVAALRAVGVRKGEPVLLVGHSQGGLVAAATASDPAVRREFTVNRVITTGAPIAAIPIPDDVEVLSIEHSNDLVPQLDGSANPDAPNWVTVHGPAPNGNPASTAQSATAQSDPLWAHQLVLYQQTAALVERSTDPSIVAWRAGLAPFVGASRPGAAWDVDVSRVATS